MRAGMKSEWNNDSSGAPGKRRHGDRGGPGARRAHNPGARPHGQSEQMELRAISLKAAMRIVDEWHRHLERPQGGKAAIAAWNDGQLVGVAIVGRPISRVEDKGEIGEVIRVATNGTPNACSFLYARAKRLIQALGFRRARTKTLPTESGASLRAVSAKELGVTTAQSWDRENRRRAEKAPIVEKLRWEL